MKLALVTLLAVVACAAVSALPAEPTGRIIGGVDALAGEFPEICIVQWIFLGTTSTLCSCVIIGDNRALTTGQCIAQAPTAGRLEVVVGVLDTVVLAPQRQRLGVASTIVHPGFTAEPLANDIAIIRVQSPFGWNEWVQPATLPAQDAIPSGVTILAGWGQTSTGVLPSTPTRLQKIQVGIVDWNQCAASVLNLGLTLRSEYICTGPLTGGIGICTGDAGGPVMQNRVVVGIISHTTSTCAAVGSASIHTRVSNFVTWINAN